MKYKVLTLTQPWATLVAIGQKRIETRSWSTSYRGPLLIHAARGLGPVGGKDGYLELCRAQPFVTELIRHKPNAGGMFYDDDYFLSLPRGAIVAMAELADCVQTWPRWAAVEPWFTATKGEQYWHVPPPEPERSFGDYSPGRYAWLLADIRALPEPIPARGALGLWTWEGDLPL